MESWHLWALSLFPFSASRDACWVYLSCVLLSSSLISTIIIIIIAIMNNLCQLTNLQDYSNDPWAEMEFACYWLNCLAPVPEENHCPTCVLQKQSGFPLALIFISHSAIHHSYRFSLSKPPAFKSFWLKYNMLMKSVIAQPSADLP